MATNQHNKKITCSRTHKCTMEARTQISNAHLKPDGDTTNMLLQALKKASNKWEDELTVTRAESHVAWIQGFIKATEYRLQPGGRGEEEGERSERSKPEEVEWTYKYNSNTQRKTVFIDNVMTKQMHTPPRCCTREGGRFVETAARLRSPLNQQQHVDSWFCLSACLMAGGCV